ncbi:MAG: carboxypeptidase regulatory-like domain-containing protein [Candidatus Kapabacteria bacterium]|nr:carboxypeptidase regulatory-like domain-containing protein [Candidatus Kapabacteria bacterium]
MKKILSFALCIIFYSTCLLQSQGYELWGWGSNIYGEIGDGTNNERDTPIQNGKATNWKVIASGNSHHNLSVKTDSSLWAWGQNDYGQLGDSSTLDRNRPTRIGLGKDWKTVAVGYDHSLALKVDGSLWGWGRNDYGQLGDNTNIDKIAPIQIGTDKEWKIIMCGDFFSFGIKNDGTLWAWGVNQSGELGDGSKTDKNVPTQIGTDKDWKNISSGYGCTLALKTDGSLWSWGWNLYGQLGDGTNDDKNIPTHIGSGTDWKDIYANAYHSMALKSDGSLWTWGYNSSGQLGNGTKVDKNTPTHIGTDTDWNFISGGLDHTTALKSDGTMWAWGYNADGELGDGTTVDKSSPIQIGTIKDWKFIAGGASHSIALKNIAATYIASGNVKDEKNNPVGNITLTMAGVSSTFTNTSGLYTFSNLNNGTYVITPRTTASYTFTPVSRTITINNASITSGIDFTAIEIKYNISGTIKDEKGQTVSNAIVNLTSNSTTLTTNSTSSGTYNLSNLSIGVYVITPQATSSYTYTPVSRTVSINGFNPTNGINFTQVELKYSITGKMKDENGNAMQNINLNISGLSSSTINTSITGAYSFANLSNGTYVITPQANSSYTFSPASRTLTVNGANITTGADFTGIELRYSLSGNIKDELNQPVANVVLNLSGASATTTNSIASGNYIFSTLLNGNYVITPQATSSYTFSPASRTVTISGGNVLAGLDFTTISTIIPTYSISGSVKDGNNVAISNITLNLVGNVNTLTNSTSNGLYQLANLKNGDYVITPQSTAQYTFNPESRTFTIKDANITSGLDFIAVPNIKTTHSLLGLVTNELNNPVAGIQLNLTGNASTFTLSQTDGVYKFSNLTNGTYIITPQENASYTFSPASKTVTITGIDISSNIDFLAIARKVSGYTISGFIRDEKNIAVPNITVSFTGNKSLTTTTLANGRYSLSNLSNGTYIITPQATSSYTFSPESRTITIINTNISTGLDFVAVSIKVGAFSISGFIQDENGIPFPNITLNLSGTSNTITKSITDGTYTFNNLIAGAYTVTPLATSSYTFSPVSTTFNITNANINSGLDFIAIALGTAKVYTVSGKISDEKNQGLADLVVNISGVSSTFTKTSTNGIYKFSNMPNGTYTITPQSVASFTFTPISRIITVDNANFTSGIDFTMVKIISLVEMDYDSNILKISPNPVKDICNISYHSEKDCNIEITLYSNTGRNLGRIYQGIATSGVNYYNLNINNNEISSGSYILEINNYQSKVLQKIIIQK